MNPIAAEVVNALLEKRENRDGLHIARSIHVVLLVQRAAKANLEQRLHGGRVHSDERKSDQIAFRDELLHDVAHFGLDTPLHIISTVIDEKGWRHVAEHDDNVLDGKKLPIVRHVQIFLNQVVVFLDSVRIDVRFIPQIQQQKLKRFADRLRSGFPAR